MPTHRSRAARAALRKPFPSEPPDLSEIEIAGLAAWEDECRRQRIVTSAWTLNGIRWRRAAIRASLEYTKRLVTHPSATPGRCDACKSHPVSIHVAYESREAPRFAHFCDACSRTMEPGWMCVATVSVQRAPRLFRRTAIHVNSREDM